MGQFQMNNLLETSRGVTWKLLSASGMEPDEIDKLLADMASELANRRNHPYSYL
jgi:hypothetical protein